ncbi:SurA N-terminal domain-containing protein [Actinacidiphila yanglinensis]|uniref:SurA N-terminal domain-containing protein n=1 Tax=Actinacidiphila yanglinensis TaxID=310779 RepID=A0A1H5ZI84_9ACTN|nr:SurA N-terminal domain-containing protein [Actinacidiphila yanglinensis]SEG36178.1 SurA N-terminal domain-containing protein [Actinacidiphila yanglinensis]
MVRRRTAVSTAAVALLLASPALTACGSGPNRTGAAAVVGDQRIAVATVQDQVADLRTAANANPQAAQAVAGATQLPTQVLNVIVQTRVVDKALAAKGLTVTAGEVQREYDAEVQQLAGGDRKAYETGMLVQYGTAPDQIDSYLHEKIAITKIISALGYQAGSDGAEKALEDYMVKTAASLDVHINPRYGAWDGKSASIGKVKNPWVVDKTPVASTDDTASATGVA